MSYKLSFNNVRNTQAANLYGELNVDTRCLNYTALWN